MGVKRIYYIVNLHDSQLAKARGKISIARRDADRLSRETGCSFVVAEGLEGVK